jgi:hypothetical protein
MEEKRPSISLHNVSAREVALFRGLHVVKEPTPRCDMCKNRRTQFGAGLNQKSFFWCQSCTSGQRPLHEDCARDNNDGLNDEHEADHPLTKWKSRYTKEVEPTFESYNTSHESVSEIEPSRSIKFEASVTPPVVALCVFKPPAGVYRLSIIFWFDPGDLFKIVSGVRRSLMFGLRFAGALGCLRFR